MKTLLSFSGRHGPVMLFCGVFLGLLMPRLAEHAKPLMGVAVFIFTLGSFLKVDRAELRANLVQPIRLALVLLWVALGVPLVAWALVTWLPLPTGTRTGILLCMLAPPVGSAAAMATMLRLNSAMALTTTVIVGLLSTVLLPPAAALVGLVEMHIDTLQMMGRLALLVMGAGALAGALRRFANKFVRANPHAMTGVSVVGLIVVAIGAMHGLRPQLLLHGQEVVAALALAFAVNVGFQVLGAVLFAKMGRCDALTVGLLSGNRNVTLVWVAASPWLMDLPQVQLYLAASVFPIFMLPLPIAKLLARWNLNCESAQVATTLAVPGSPDVTLPIHLTEEAPGLTDQVSQAQEGAPGKVAEQTVMAQ